MLFVLLGFGFDIDSSSHKVNGKQLPSSSFLRTYGMYDDDTKKYKIYFIIKDFKNVYALHACFKSSKFIFQLSTAMR